MGHPYANEFGMAHDDPGEPAEYRCDICQKFFTEDEQGCEVDHEFGDLCANCVRDIEWQDAPHRWIMVGITLLFLILVTLVYIVVHGG